MAFFSGQVVGDLLEEVGEFWGCFGGGCLGFEHFSLEKVECERDLVAFEIAQDSVGSGFVHGENLVFYLIVGE